ncbi:MAG: hypothetical protein QOK03_2683 [Candidatus Binataceae bacterium]|nr:hypothetical protein [Candidatus Binataceae bacterium]
MKSEKPIGRADSPDVSEAASTTREGTEDASFNDFSRGVISRERERGEDGFARQPDAWHMILRTQIEKDIGNHRMNVEVEMAIDVVEATS